MSKVDTAKSKCVRQLTALCVQSADALYEACAPLEEARALLDYKLDAMVHLHDLVVEQGTLPHIDLGV